MCRFGFCRLRLVVHKMLMIGDGWMDRIEMDGWIDELMDGCWRPFNLIDSFFLALDVALALAFVGKNTCKHTRTKTHKHKHKKNTQAQAPRCVEKNF